MNELESAGAELPRVSAAVVADGVAHNVAVSSAQEALAPELESEPLTQPERVERPVEGVKRRRVRSVAGDRWIARVLRGGALVSGGMLVVSLGLEVLPHSENTHVAIDLLRKGAASLLLVTPVARLAMAGTLLGLKGEWRYAAIAAGVLGLLGIAVGTGIHA